MLAKNGRSAGALPASKVCMGAGAGEAQANSAWLRGVLAPGQRVVDVGANVGYFTVLMSRLVGPRGSVVAVEPDRDNLRLLRLNLWLNRCHNVTVWPLAAWRERDVLEEKPAVGVRSWVRRVAPAGGLVYAHAMSQGAGIEATWSQTGEGERLWFVGTLAIIRIPADASDGRFSLIEFLFPQHASPPLHTHPQDESYVVLAGKLTIVAGDDRFELAGPSGSAVVPMGVGHTFRVDTETARVLILSTPAGLEAMVRDIGVPATAATLPPPDTPRPTPEQMGALFTAHGQVDLGPPLSPDD